jgi:type IV pilus assembly protein PilV
MTRPVRPHAGNRATARGFSLVEIMVAVVVICVGLLGIAKMQALAVSSTNMARLRSMAAFQAASLASIMHTNRYYWATAAAVTNSPTTVAISSTGVVTITPAGFAQPWGQCVATTISPNPVCPLATNGPTVLAGEDIQEWATKMVGLLPNMTAQINCQGAIQPPSCTIQMWWSEQTGTINSQETSTAITAQTGVAGFDYYTLYVAP